ncbi:40s ribosomal protein s5-1 [Hordeum vulgare]|nr:40s ribosomal protein s5-1 [Hordeum vulgare]
MTPSSSTNFKFYEKVINPYLPEVMKHPQAIEMREGVLHILIHPMSQKGGDKKARLVAVEYEIFKCQWMVERGSSANHSMFMDFIQENKLGARNVLEALFKLQKRIKHLQAQIFDLQNKKFEYESRFKMMSITADFRIPATRSSFYDGEPMP